jgi:hypothetical protein
LRINAIVDDHIAVAVALVFAKLSINAARAGIPTAQPSKMLTKYKRI